MANDVFETVSEPARRAILDLLMRGPRSVGEIVERTGMSQPNASRHLRILRESGLVQSSADRQRRIYELRPEGLAELIGWLGPYQQLWRRHLDALESQLDRQAADEQG